MDWLARKIALPRSPASVWVERANSFAEEMDALWAAVRARYSFTLVRDHAYLNWRYVDCPTPYQIWIARRNAGVAGYVVSFASPAEPIAYIVDLFTSPEDTQAASLLVRTAVDFLLAEGLQLVYTWTLQSGASSVGHQLLKRACAIASRNPLHLAMRFLDKGIDTSRLPSDGWHLVTGDFDGV